MKGRDLMSDQQLIQDADLSDVVNSGMQIFAAALIFRSIANANDGLRQVQRRILYQTEESHLTPKAKYQKVVRLYGDVMGRLHPHGDSSIYGAIVNLSQDWKQNVPLISIHGNNGSISGDSSAAARYIEARQTEYAPLMLAGLKKNAVQMVPNFDQTQEEPAVLPAAIPYALINGTSGIGYGMASNIAPHNPKELLTATLKLIDNPDATTDELADIIQGPDFPTYGELLMDKEQVRQEIETGRAKFVVRAKIDIHATEKHPYLDIVQIPYGISVETLIKQLADRLKDYSKVLGRARPVNETEGDDVHIKIICKNGTSKALLEQIRQFLFDNTKCETSISVTNRLLYNGEPLVKGIRDYLLNFIQFRLATLKRIWQFDYETLSKRIEVINGLLRAADMTDEIVAEAKRSANRADLEQILQADYQFTATQAKAVAGTSIYQLGRQDISQLSAERDTKQAHADELHQWLTDDAAATAELKRDIEHSLSVFKDADRKTTFFKKTSAKKLDALTLSSEQLTEKKKVMAIIKKTGFSIIGRKAYQNQIDDYSRRDIMSALPAITNQYVIGITEDGQAVTRFADDLQNMPLDNPPRELYREVPSLAPHTKFIGGAVYDATNEAMNTKRILMISKFGYIKLMDIDKLAPNTNRKTYIKRTTTASGLRHDGDKLIYAQPVTDQFLKTHQVIATCEGVSRRRKVELSKIIDRHDGQSTSGGSYINTGSPKGAHPITSFEFDELPQEQSDDGTKDGDD